MLPWVDVSRLIISLPFRIRMSFPLTILRRPRKSPAIAFRTGDDRPTSRAEVTEPRRMVDGTSIPPGNPAPVPCATGCSSPGQRCMKLPKSSCSAKGFAAPAISCYRTAAGDGRRFAQEAIAGDGLLHRFPQLLRTSGLRIQIEEQENTASIRRFACEPDRAYPGTAERSEIAVQRNMMRTRCAGLFIEPKDLIRFGDNNRLELHVGGVRGRSPRSAPRKYTPSAHHPVRLRTLQADGLPGRPPAEEPFPPVPEVRISGGLLEARLRLELTSTGCRSWDGRPTGRRYDNGIVRGAHGYGLGRQGRRGETVVEHINRQQQKDLEIWVRGDSHRA